MYIGITKGVFLAIVIQWRRYSFNLKQILINKLLSKRTHGVHGRDKRQLKRIQRVCEN